MKKEIEADVIERLMRSRKEAAVGNLRAFLSLHCRDHMASAKHGCEMLMCPVCSFRNQETGRCTIEDFITESLK